MRSPGPTFVVLGLALPCFGQTASLLNSQLSRGLTLPPTSAALADEATAPLINPAGLTFVGDAQLWYLHERNIAVGDVGDGLYLADSFLDVLGAGVSVEWLRLRGSDVSSYRKTTWAFSLGAPELSLGAGFNSFSSASTDLDGMSSVDLGVASRPFRFLSLGGTVHNVDAPAKGAVAFERRYDVGAGFRLPPLGDRYTLAADFIFGENRGADNGRLAYTLLLEPVRGFVMGAGVSHGLHASDDLLVQLSLTLNIDHVGITYAAGLAPEGADHLIAVRASREKYPSLALADGKVALLDLGELLSRAQNPALALLGAEPEDPYLQVAELLDEATRDTKLRGVVLKIDSLPAGLGKIEDLRDAILRLRSAGKRVLAVLLTGGDSEYLLAAAADKVYAVPQAVLTINGFAAHATFLGGSMSKLGVSWDVARVGAYKNAPDALTRSSISPEQQEAIDALLDNDVRRFQTLLGSSRLLSKAQIERAWAEGLLTPAQAKADGIIDDVLDPRDLAQKLTEQVPGARFDPHYVPGDGRDPRWGEHRKIAIVPVIGSIVSGKSKSNPLGDEQLAGAETVVRALQEASEDDEVVAIVLRVDSGGGDGLASDLMYRAVLEAKTKKPVVASMGDVAASGGYYAAMGADEIWAEPTTVTGSIGVFLVKPALEGLGDKLGVHQDVSKRGELSDLLGLYHPWTPTEREAAQRWVDAFYDGFIGEVSKSRNIDKSEVDKMARGRVWSGEDAKARHLIDHLGSLFQAVEAARKRAGISEKEELTLEVVRERPGSFSSISSALFARVLDAHPEPSLPEGVRALASELGVDQALVSSPGTVRAEMQFKLTVQ